MAADRLVDDVTADKVRSIVAGLAPGDTRVGFDSDLRQSGLSSLTMTRLWFALRQELGVDVGVGWLGGCGTVRELADRVIQERRSGGNRRAPQVAADPERRYEPFALSELQQTYLIGKDPQRTWDPVGCHGYREFQLDDVDADRLGDAWRRVVEQHEALRIVLTLDGRQRIQPRIPQVSTPVHDLTDRTEQEFTEHVLAVRERLSHEWHAVGAWPLFTVEFSRGPGGRTVVHLSLDATINDAHGLSVLLSDWWQWYQNPGRTVPEPTISVRDCLVALAEERSENRDERLAYWDRRLKELPPGPLPVKPTDSRRRTPLGGVLGRGQWAALRGLAADWGVSPTAVVLTLFAETLAAEGDADPFSVVLTTNDRAWLPDEADPIAGPLTSWIVSPMVNTSDLPLPEAVRGIHEQLWSDLENAALAEVAAVRRSKNRAPERPVVFTGLLDTVRYSDGGLAGAMSYAISQTTGVALDHQMWEKNGELHFRWDVIEEAFEPGLVRALFDRFCDSLERARVEPRHRG